MRWLAAMPPVLEAFTKLAVVVATAATPSVIMANRSQEKAEQTETRLGYANENTNVALGALAVITVRLDSAMARIDRLERREARRMRRSPEAMYGPDVPPDWVPQPPKQPSWWERHFGRR
jgi:type II secretory pathway component PulK